MHVIYASACGQIEAPFENFINYVTAMQAREKAAGAKSWEHASQKTVLFAQENEDNFQGWTHVKNVRERAAIP